MTIPRLLGRSLALAIVALLAVQACAAAKKPKPKPAPPPAAAANEAGDPLDHVLHTMDQAAATFRSAQADFVWTTFNSVIKEVDGTDKGKIYFRHNGKEIEMAADMAAPNEQQIIFSGGKIKVYRVQTKQVNVYDAGAHREEFETFLVLGFGSSGSDMRRSFEVKYLGDEKIGDIQTARLQLTPIAPKVQQQFPRIDLWIDTQRGLSLRQQLWQTNGDYRVADYSNIQVNKKIADNVFKLRTSGDTTTVNH
jgi:outer membrane lipoprotein-sorting protein